MIYGEHRLGFFNALRIIPAEPSVGMMVVEIGDEDEVLERADVERLRALCDEALS